jgi:hypothetical protein
MTFFGRLRSEPAADVMALIGREQAEAAARYRKAQGLGDPPPPRAQTAGEVIDTAAFAGRCTFYEEWPAGSVCRVLMAEARVADLPADVLAALRAGGLGDWLDGAAGDDVVLLGEAAPLSVYEGERPYGPPRRVPVAEIVARTRTTLHRAAQEAREREVEEAARRRRQEQERVEQARLAERHRAEEEAREAERRQDPRYCLRVLEQKQAALEGK